MSNQTAITPYVNFKNLIKSENVQERFAALLDKRKDEFLASLLSLVTADKNLLECRPETIFAAAAKAAILRLPIAKELGYAYIVPFKQEATFIAGYKGLIQLAIRTGQYLMLNATNIYQGQDVIEDQITGAVRLGGNRTGDEVIGYCAYFKLRNGFEKFLYMSRESVIKHAKRYSKSFNNDRSAWSTNFDDMGKKTVLRLLLGKYGLLSIEMQDADTQEAPLMTNDPRLTVPAFADLSDNTIEGSAVDVAEPETPPEPEQPPAEMTPAAFSSTAEWVVEEGFAANVHEAANILKRVNSKYTQSENALKEWMRAYRGWRDLGGTPEQASKSANAGEMPK